MRVVEIKRECWSKEVDLERMSSRFKDVIVGSAKNVRRCARIGTWMHNGVGGLMMCKV